MFAFSTFQIIYIVLTPILILIVIGLISFLLYRKIYYKRHFDLVCYHKLKYIVDKNDYLLLNNILLKTNNHEKLFINHMVFGKKFIYLITRNYLSYLINGRHDDVSLITLNNDGKRQYFPNPMIKNINIIKNLSSMYKIDEHFFVAIDVLNDDCKINVKNTKNNSIINLRKIASTISEFENNEEYDLDQDELLKFAKIINEDNLNKDIYIKK